MLAGNFGSEHNIFLCFRPILEKSKKVSSPAIKIVRLDKGNATVVMDVEIVDHTDE